jgi:hypothetical protein
MANKSQTACLNPPIVARSATPIPFNCAKVSATCVVRSEESLELKGVIHVKRRKSFRLFVHGKDNGREGTIYSKQASGQNSGYRQGARLWYARPIPYAAP